jgi:hypothetical protein
MDDNYVIVIVVVACVAAVHQIIAASSIIFDDVPTVREKWLVKKPVWDDSGQSNNGDFTYLSCKDN